MNAITQPVAGCELSPVPSTCLHVRRLMLAMSQLIGGHLETAPENWNPALKHTLLMPLAELIMIGTRCDRPLLVREADQLSQLIGYDCLIVRAATMPCQATFDLIMRGPVRPLLGYRLWVAPVSGSCWLIPTAGERTYLRLGAFGIEQVNCAPFVDAGERDRGTRQATEVLTVAAKGWF